MPKLGLSTGLTRSGLTTPGIVTDNLVLKHNYAAGGVVPVSDGAAYFGGAGTNNRIAITSTEFSVHDTTHTFAFWAKRSDKTVNHSTVLGNSGSQVLSHIRFNGSGSLYIESDTDTDVAAITLNSDDTNWHYYAITTSGSGAVTAFQDGVSCSVSGDVNGDNLTIDLIGAQNTSGGDNEFGGYLCNVGIWSGVLTQTQIKSIMNKNYAGLTSSETTNLVSWWNLSADANDSTGTNNGTLA